MRIARFRLDAMRCRLDCCSNEARGELRASGKASSARAFSISFRLLGLFTPAQREGAHGLAGSRTRRGRTGWGWWTCWGELLLRKGEGGIDLAFSNHLDQLGNLQLEIELGIRVQDLRVEVVDESEGLVDFP